MWFSPDNVNWTLHTTITSLDFTPTRIGLVAFDGSEPPSSSVAYYDYFQILGPPPPEPCCYLLGTCTAGSSGQAYVIVGDVHPWHDVSGTQAALVDLAAEQAAARLLNSGYAVTRIGSAVGGDYANSGAFVGALSDHGVTAIWLFAHGPTKPDIRDDDAGFKLRDRWVDRAEVGTARAASGSTLRELTLISCNAGYDFNRALWGADEETQIWAKARYVIGAEANVHEFLNRCEEPLTPETGFERESGTGLAEEPDPEFLGMPLLTRTGLLGDSLYGTVAGSLKAVVPDNAGAGAFADTAAWVEGTLTGQAAGDTVYVWMNRYTSMPADTLPPGRETLVAFAVAGSCDAAGTQLVFKYGNQTPVDPNRIEAWRFDDSLRVFVRLDASVDSVAHTVTTSTDQWGTFLLATGPISGVGDDTSTAGLSISFRGNPALGHEPVTVRFSLPSRSAVKLRIYSVAGNLVATLLDGETAEGVHTVWWNGRDTSGRKVPAGCYLVRLESVSGDRVGKLVIMQ